MSKVLRPTTQGNHPYPSQGQSNPHRWVVCHQPYSRRTDAALYACAVYSTPNGRSNDEQQKRRAKKAEARANRHENECPEKRRTPKTATPNLPLAPKKREKSPRRWGSPSKTPKPKSPNKPKPAPSKSRNAAKERAAKERAAKASAPSKSSTPKKPSNKGKKARKSANPPRKTGLRDAQGKYLRVGDRVRTVEGIDRQFARPGDVVARFGTITKRDPRGLVVVSWDGKDGKYSTRNPKNLVYAAPYRSNPDESGVGAVFKFAGSALGSFGVSGLLHAGLRAVADRMMGRQKRQSSRWIPPSAQPRCSSQAALDMPSKARASTLAGSWRSDASPHRPCWPLSVQRPCDAQAVHGIAPDLSTGWTVRSRRTGRPRGPIL